MSNKKKNSRPTRTKEKDLVQCKHCKTPLLEADIEKQKKKWLTEKYGVYWTGSEKPYIQIYKIHCPNTKCRKTYTHRIKGCSWLYK